MSGELAKTAEVLYSAATELKMLATEQAVLNKVTASALDGIVNRLDEHTRMIADHGATLSLMRELLNAVHMRAGLDSRKE